MSPGDPIADRVADPHHRPDNRPDHSRTGGGPARTAGGKRVHVMTRAPTRPTGPYSAPAYEFALPATG